MAARHAAVDDHARWPGIIAYVAGLGVNRFSLLQAFAFLRRSLNLSFKHPQLLNYA